MANIRRHFNFSTKSSVHQDQDMPFSTSSGKQLGRQFDKNSLMNDICNSLDLCCSYIQALNSLCGAGSSLAKNLFHAVREVPAYHNVALQFVSVWEEVSKATAGASAAVKTETLMMLQEILNSLEMGVEEADAENVIANSFQVIGTCLSSFIELQAQFSLSTWKSFSKVSKHFTSDSVRHSLQWKSLERSPSKISINTDLNATIKKHFSHLFSKAGTSKVESIETSQNLFNSPPVSNVSVYSHFGSESASGTPPTSSVWSPPSRIWEPTDSAVNFSQSVKSSDTESLNSTPISSGLDEVINLLSCVPAEQLKNRNDQNQNYFSNQDNMYHLLPKVTVPSTSGRLGVNQPWTKERREVAVGYDSWIWRIDQMNCSGLPANSDASKLQTNPANDAQIQWDSKELQKWNSSLCETGSSSDDGSSVHGPDATEYFLSGINGSFGKSYIAPIPVRKQNSGESMPGGLENISESKEEGLWTTQTKISTWPFKQSAFRNSDIESQDNPEYTDYQHNNYFSSS